MSVRTASSTQVLVAGRTPNKPLVINARTPDSLPARLFGLGLAGAGVAHFTAPKEFDRMTAIAFPTNTRRWTYQNGFTELVLGLAVAFRRTRPAGVIGLIGYVAFLLNNAANRRFEKRSATPEPRRSDSLLSDLEPV